MKGPELIAEKNRLKIIQAALELFQTYGIKKVSVNDVALKAGVTTATVYNRFGDKDTLIREVIKVWYGQILDDYRKVLNSKLPFEEKLQNIISFKSDAVRKIHGEFLLATTSDDPEIRQYLETGYIPDVNRSIMEFFNEGKKQGYVDPELSVESILRFTEIIRRGINAEADLSSDPGYSINLLRELTPIVLYGIIGKQNKSGKK